MSPFRDAAPRPSYRCPRDQCALEARWFAGVVVHHCLYCRGSWLDEDMLERVRRDPMSREHLADDAVAHAPRERPGPDESQPVRCCACGRVADGEDYVKGAFVRVERCAGHGVWFDAGELFVAVYHHGLTTVAVPRGA